MQRWGLKYSVTAYSGNFTNSKRDRDKLISPKSVELPRHADIIPPYQIFRSQNKDTKRIKLLACFGIYTPFLSKILEQILRSIRIPSFSTEHDKWLGTSKGGCILIFHLQKEQVKPVANLQNNRTKFFLSILDGLKDNSNAGSDNYAQWGHVGIWLVGNLKLKGICLSSEWVFSHSNMASNNMTWQCCTKRQFGQE